MAAPTLLETLPDGRLLWEVVLDLYYQVEGSRAYRYTTRDARPGGSVAVQPVSVEGRGSPVYVDTRLIVHCRGCMTGHCVHADLARAHLAHQAALPKAA